MQAKITVITLGVDDLQRALRFYRDGLGLATKGIIGQEFEHGAVVFIDLQAGLRLALWPRSSMAHDTGLAACGLARNDAVTLGHNVASAAEVNAVMAQAQAAGAHILKAAHSTFWGGYAGYFQDPDGHIWEVVWNPQWNALQAEPEEDEDEDAEIDGFGRYGQVFVRCTESGGYGSPYDTTVIFGFKNGQHWIRRERRYRHKDMGLAQTWISVDEEDAQDFLRSLKGITIPLVLENEDMVTDCSDYTLEFKSNTSVRVGWYGGLLHGRNPDKSFLRMAEVVNWLLHYPPEDESELFD